MNKLFIIGNGFDLSHNLKTSYSDFILWFLNKIIRIKNSQRTNIYSNPLIEINDMGYQHDDYYSLKEIRQALKDSRIGIEAKNEFLKRLLNNYLYANWVDIEYEYYVTLLEIYRAYDAGRGLAKKRIVELNKCLDLIKDQLAEYLTTIPMIEEYNSSILDNFKSEMRYVTPEDTRLLVFNYTSTIDKYAEAMKISKDNVIYIHGKLGDIDNPLIFGYGDEIDENYRKLENLNYNEILRNMKSFSYFRASNYRTLNTFLNGSKVYDVVIMGHSCGISDRVLLNSIFTRPGCNSIKIYYHRKNETETDYFEKTQEISRHFDDKTRMRDLILPFPQSSPLS